VRSKYDYILQGLHARIRLYQATMANHLTSLKCGVTFNSRTEQLIVIIHTTVMSLIYCRISIYILIE